MIYEHDRTQPATPWPADQLATVLPPPVARKLQEAAHTPDAFQRRINIDNTTDAIKRGFPQLFRKD